MTGTQNINASREQLVILLKKSAEGDKDAFANLYNLTNAKLFGVCLRILNERQAAEDVLQDVYVKVWRSARGFDSARASPITWLATIARNTSIDKKRSVGKWNMVSDDILEQKASQEEGVLDNMLSREGSMEIMKCLDTLEQRQSDVIRTAFFEGLSYNEIAEKLDKPLGTIKSWVRRGLIKLKGCLGDA